MKPFSTNPKVLLSTVYRRFENDLVDPMGELTHRMPRFSMRRDFSPGLRFIKQNVPEVEILEYPTWRGYAARLREGWDVVGFSFYQNEIAEIERMAEEARRCGVARTWAGNYGALDGRVPQIVDRVVIGPGEGELAKLFGRDVREGDVEIPPVFGYFTTVPGNIRHFAFGVLYTQRGCPYKCTFCQTPVFDKKRYHFDVGGIDRVLRHYKREGVNYVFIVDEFFGARPEAAERVTELLARYGLRWYCQSRATTVLRHLDEWYERGMRFAQIGVESLDQDVLDAVGKKQTREEVFSYARRMGEKKGLVSVAGYMMGFANMTAQNIVDDVLALRRTGFDIYAVNVVTPYPRTPFWDETDAKYGIFDRTYRHFDSKHLVWRHPHVTPGQMELLYRKAVGVLNCPSVAYWNNLRRFMRGGERGGGLGALWRGVVKDPLVSTRVCRKKPFFFPVSTRNRDGEKSGTGPASRPGSKSP